MSLETKTNSTDLESGFFTEFDFPEKDQASDDMTLEGKESEFSNGLFTEFGDDDVAPQYGENINFLQKTDNVLEKYASKLPDALSTLVKKAPRLLMHASIGTGIAHLMQNNYGIPLVLADLLEPIVTPLALQNVASEEKEFRNELPASIKEQLDLPELDMDIMKKSAQEFKDKHLKKGIAHRVVQLPFELFGIDTDAEDEWDQAFENTAEIIHAFGGPRKFSDLIFLELPEATKALFGSAGKLYDKIVGAKNIPKSISNTVEKIVRDFQKHSSKLLKDRLPKSLKDRVEKGGSPLGFSPKDHSIKKIQPPTTNAVKYEELGRKISPESFEDNFVGGKEQIENIQNEAKFAREKVSSAYSAAENSYEGLSDYFPELIKKLSQEKKKFLAGRRKKVLNSAEKTVVESIDNMVNFLVKKKSLPKDLKSKDIKNKKIVKKMVPRKVPVSALIKTAKSWSSKINYEDIYGDASKFLAREIPELNEAAIDSVRNAGRNPDLIKEADSVFASWTKKYGNEKINPYLKKNISSPEALYKKSTDDSSSFRAIKNVLEGTPKGQAVINKTQRSIVENKMLKYIEKPDDIGGIQYIRDLRKLKVSVGRDIAKTADEALRSFIPKKSFKASRDFIGKVPLPSPFLTASSVAKEIKLTPEKIVEMGKTRIGIKELRNLTGKTEKGKKLFEIYKRQQLRSILQEGELIKKVKGKDLFRVLNNEKNFDLVSEFIGDEAATEALNTAKKLANKPFTLANVKKTTKSIFAIKVYRMLKSALAS